MSLSPPLKVGKLQTALHTKAKNSPDYRFYALYDKIYRRDVLGFAYERCRANRGVPGVTARASPRSRNTASIAGWTNWRKNSEVKRTHPNLSNACTSLNRMASNGRWAFLASKIA